MIEQPWNDERLKINGVFIGCVTAENATEIMAMHRDSLRYRWLRDNACDVRGTRLMWESKGDVGFAPDGVELDLAIDDAIAQTHNVELNGAPLAARPSDRRERF